MLSPSYAKQFQKSNSQNVFVLVSRSDLLHLWTSLGWKRIQPQFLTYGDLQRANPEEKITNYDWLHSLSHSQSRTSLSKRGDLVVLGTAKMRHRNPLQQSNAYNPFSEKSKKMIQDMGNVELFELCETIPKVQGKECLLYWNQGIVYCTCGHLLRENQSSRGILRWKLDIFSIPNYVIKKERPHGNRHRKTEESKRILKEFTIASRKIQDFVTRNSELIELKKYASRLTRWRRKISLVAWRPTSFWDTKRIGGSLSTLVDEMHRWNSDQTSAKH